MCERLQDHFWKRGVSDTYRQEGEVVAQEGAQGRGRGDVNLGELGGRHLGLGALAKVDGAQGQRQSPQAAALGQLPYERRRRETRFNYNTLVPLILADNIFTLNIAFISADPPSPLCSTHL